MIRLFATVAQIFLAIFTWWREQKIRAEGAKEAERKGLEDVNQRAAKADAAADAVRADPDLLSDDGHKRPRKQPSGDTADV